MTAPAPNAAPSTAQVAMFDDGLDVVIATPRRGRAPMEVNPAMRGTSAQLDPALKVWRLPADEAPAVVANLKARGVTVAGVVLPWIVKRDHRTPDPLPECVVCATPYKRLGVAPRHCVKCGDRLELQVVRVLERITARSSIACDCGQPVDQSSLFCGDCGRAVQHG